MAPQGIESIDQSLGLTISHCCLLIRRSCPHSLSPHTSVLGTVFVCLFLCFYQEFYLTGRQEEGTPWSNLCSHGHPFPPPHTRLLDSHNINAPTLCWPDILFSCLSVMLGQAMTHSEHYYSFEIL